jgi:hypothetical protein
MSEKEIATIDTAIAELARLRAEVEKLTRERNMTLIQFEETVARLCDDKAHFRTRAESAERKLAVAVEASKAVIHLLKPAKGEAHGQLEGVPDSHLFELVWARDDDGPQDYPCVTAGQLRRFIHALTELEKTK